jgi:hypothetical protein
MLMGGDLMSVLNNINSAFTGNDRTAYDEAHLLMCKVIALTAFPTPLDEDTLKTRRPIVNLLNLTRGNITAHFIDATLFNEMEKSIHDYWNNHP